MPLNQLCWCIGGKSKFQFQKWAAICSHHGCVGMKGHLWNSRARHPGANHPSTKVGGKSAHKLSWMGWKDALTTSSHTQPPAVLIAQPETGFGDSTHILGLLDWIMIDCLCLGIGKRKMGANGPDSLRPCFFFGFFGDSRRHNQWWKWKKWERRWQPLLAPFWMPKMSKCQGEGQRFVGSPNWQKCAPFSIYKPNKQKALTKSCMGFAKI